MVVCWGGGSGIDFMTSEENSELCVCLSLSCFLLVLLKTVFVILVCHCFFQLQKCSYFCFALQIYEPTLFALSR